MNHYDQYQKYKKKYLDLKNQLNNSSQYGGNCGNYGNNQFNNQFNSQTTNRYQTGGAEFDLKDEVAFWGRQMMEHLLLLHLGLDEEELKNSALQNHMDWKRYLTENFFSKGVNPGPDQAFLTTNELEKIGLLNKNVVNGLIDQTIQYKSKLVKTLNSGQWVGWIYPAMAQHMLEEAEYFKRKVNGPDYTPEQETKFVVHHHSTEMGATTQLLDPTEKDDIKIAKSYADICMSKLSGRNKKPFPKQWTSQEEAILRGQDPVDLATLMRISLKYSRELTQFAKETGQKIDSKQLKSIIHPVLAHHIFREFYRFTKRLEQLGAQ
ncbi:hypothetical protein [Acanthamoeba polyphaga mimivirus]|nr:hypothetical protein [Acanthamoeba castellanii mamavirus]EJN40994.1 hypothetical protein lvs_L491 [Acanthamoeba polyphaga lentillevirus]UMZ07896.1 hypothetical protein [Acanthamoeba polyphaga mimivirus]